MSKIGIPLAIVAIVGLFAVTANAEFIFDSTGPNAPIVLFDANDYNATTGALPNIGTGGDAYDAFDVAGLNLGVDEPDYSGVNDHPGLTANAFGPGLHGMTFVPAGNGTGEALAYDASGLPNGEARQVTLFAVVRSGTMDDETTPYAIFGYGEGDGPGDSTGPVGFDEIYMWDRRDAEPSFHFGTSGSTQGSNMDIVAGRVTVLAMTQEADDEIFFWLKDGTVDSSTGPAIDATDVVDRHGMIGHAWENDVASHFYDGEMAALAIVADVMSDSDIAQIVDDLYARYDPQGSSGVPLIPEPATMALLGVGGLMVLRRRRSA